MPSPARVIANLVVGQNGATVAQGSSRALTNRTDRERFHQLRASARAICIGGTTYRCEPYSKPPLPLYVSSREPSPSEASSINFYHLSPTELVELALEKEGAPVLVEGGVRFLEELIEKQRIDEFHITRSPHLGDESFFDEDCLRLNYKCVNTEAKAGTNFELWVPIGESISQ